MVYKYKGKKGEVSYYFTFINSDKKRVTRRGFKTKDDAILAEIKYRKKYKEESKYENYYLSTVTEKYLDELKSKNAESTCIRFSEMFKANINDYIDDKPLKDYTLEDITEFGKKLNSIGKTPYVINHAVSYLNRVFNYGITNGYCDSNPCKGFRKYPEIERGWIIWTPEEFNNAIKYEDNYEYYALFNCLFWLGCRRCEILCLRWSDINLDQQTLTIDKHIDFRGNIVSGRKNARSNKKDGKKLVLRIDSELTDILRSLKQESSQIDGWSKESFVFGLFKPLPAETIRRRLRNIAIKSGNEIISPHMLRHSHASYLINDGATPAEVARRLGDSIQVVLTTYSHIFDNNEDITLERINKTKEGQKNGI